MRTIALINVFFGEFPWYFNLFLKSCETNYSIQFFIFSDQPKPKNCPRNVKIIPFTIEGFNNLASQKLSLNIDIKFAYKLCDFKPAYGVIFADYLKDFQFWGITDIDLVLGRIREFISEELLNEYEIISVRNDYPTGFFMLFKNDKKINELFRKSKDYKKVFTSQKHYCFDECNFEHGFLSEEGNIFDIKTEIESMHHILMQEMLQNSLKIHFDFFVIEGTPGKLFWNNGLLSYKKEFEALCYHLILYKENKFSKKEKWEKVPNQFFIDKYMIRKKNIFSQINYFFHEILTVNILTLLWKTDSVLSQNLLPKVAKKIENGIYTNGKFKRQIVKNKQGINSFSFSPSKEFFLKSHFRKHTYFFKNQTNVFYQFSPDYQVLSEILSDGSSFILVRE